MDLTFGPYRLKRQERRIEGPEGAVELSARAFDLLCVLLDRPGEVVTKDAIFAAVWPGVVVEENTLQVHMSALRKALDPNMIATVHGRGYKYAGPAPVPVARDVRQPATSPRKPVIVVLPFDNLSGDPAQQYFSDGITQDIIDRLTRFRMISVAGQNSLFSQNHRSEELSRIREALAIDFLVTGNVRRSEDRIRIAVRLSDASSENAVWANHYDRPLTGIFAVQDEVASLIASSLLGRVELEVATRRPPAGGASVPAFELVLRGMWQFKKLTPESHPIARECFRQAIALDPGNAEAHRWLSSSSFNAWTLDLDRSHLLEGRTLAERAIELDPANAQCHTAFALCELFLRGPEEALITYERALALNPTDANVQSEVCLVQAYRGEYAVSHAWFAQASALNPLPPPWYAEFHAIAVFAEEQYADALPAFLAIPDFGFDLMYSLSCLGHLGRREQVRDLLARGLPVASPDELLAAAELEPYRDATRRECLLEGLAKALALSKG